MHKNDHIQKEPQNLPMKIGVQKRKLFPAFLSTNLSINHQPITQRPAVVHRISLLNPSWDGSVARLHLRL